MLSELKTGIINELHQEIADTTGPRRECLQQLLELVQARSAESGPCAATCKEAAWLEPECMMMIVNWDRYSNS